MCPRLPSYFHTHRRRSGFTQAELAFLLGCNSGTQISRYERLVRKPSHQILVAYAVLFDLHPQELYPELFDDVTVLLMSRGQSLYCELQGATGRKNRAKLDHLEELMERLEESTNLSMV